MLASRDCAKNSEDRIFLTLAVEGVDSCAINITQIILARPYLGEVTQTHEMGSSHSPTGRW